MWGLGFVPVKVVGLVIRAEVFCETGMANSEEWNGHLQISAS